MERSKRDLEALVASQKEQLIRYEKRLKDVVTAYKGLLKEKEALETSLTAVTTVKETVASEGADNEENAKLSEINRSASTESVTSENSSNLQTQIITLMNSLATLSAEKSRMEASFQADKKQLRAQLTQKDQAIADLEVKIKENEGRAKANVDEIKAKWIIERQEREKETNNQMLMIRELQKLYADERHLKENIEMQLNNFKTQFANNEAEFGSLRDLQTQLKEAKMQLKQMQTEQTVDKGAAYNAAILKQVQQEMQQLKEQHIVAIKNEQKRVMLAEEESRKQAALHEDRVANLEARLAELSNTVGCYDRLRQQDQDSIQTLKKKLHELERNADISEENRDAAMTKYNRKESVSEKDIGSIVEEIMRLKKLLISENARSSNPVDIAQVLAIGADHVQCQEDINRLQKQCDAERNEITQLQEKIDIQKSHISTLQDKVKVLNRNIDEQEIELKQQADKIRQAVKDERSKWKTTLTEMENTYRCRVNDLEQQLQKQRQRSLQLLDEKEQEIKTLHTSFEVFQNATTANFVHSSNVDIANTTSSDAESTEGHPPVTHNKIMLKSKKLSVGENCHIIHYANEIARKDIEITNLRKAKYAAETSLRKAIQEKVTAQEELNDKIESLEEEVDRLERCKTREGANLEYLKNVIISFIVTKDSEGKRHMMNAISAVLQFTPTEIQTINSAFHKK